MSRTPRERPRRESGEKAADDPKSLWAAVVESCEDAILSTDLEGIVTGWNDAAARIFGYTADEIIGQSIFHLIPEELRAQETTILENIKTGKKIESFRAIRLTKTGEPILISLTLSPVRDNRGSLVGTSTIARNVSGEGGSAEARFRLAAIVESSDDVIVSKDLNGIITSWNNAAARLFGYTAEEMIGESILKIIPRELYAEESEILRKLRTGERIDHYETLRVNKNGETVQVSLTISPVKDDEGHVIGSSKIARDISGRKQMEQSLIQSEKLAATGRMAATIAHEINNPLDAVMNLIYLARTSVAQNSSARSYLLTAEKEMERVSHIARQTLGYYRDPGVPTEVSLEQLFADVLAVYHSKILAGNINVDCRFGHRRPIHASKGELMQIFSNLITNSIDAMPQGGVLSIGTRELEEEGIVIVVRDNGAGIRADHLEKIFEPFFTTKGSLGTGIGLWVVKQLVEKRAGTIAIKSSITPPENGTTIEVYIPFTT